MPKWLGNRFGDAVPVNPGGAAPSAIYSMFDQYYMKQEGGWAESFSASGGTEITSGSNKYHVFTADTPSPQQNLVVTGSKSGVEILVVGGGGGGAAQHGGGGGAGGLLHHPSFTLSSGTYTTTVGGAANGAAAGPGPGNGTATYSTSGNPTYFGPPSTPNGFTSTGGGGSFPSGRQGGGSPQPLVYQNAPPGSNPFQGAGLPGGSGGGTGEETAEPGGTATQSPMNGATGYGNEGGNSSSSGSRGSGGGGGGSRGQHGGEGGNGGDGRPFSSFPAPVIAPAIPSPQQSAFISAVGGSGIFAGGGGRGGPTQGSGGPGGGGSGGAGPNPGTVGNAGVYGTGSGGGGGGGFGVGGGNGGSGIILVLYPTS